MATTRKSSAFIFTAIIIVFAACYAECFGQNSFKERIHFNVGIGYGNYDMKRAIIWHDNLEGFIFNDSSYKRIEGGWDYYGEIVFDLSRNISIGGGVIYSNGRRDLSEWQRFLDDYNPAPKPDPIIYKASLFAPYLKIKYRSIKDKLHYSVNADLYYGFAALDAEIDTVTTRPPPFFENFKFKSEDIGFSIALGLSFKLIDGLFFDNMIGYRNLVTGELEGPDGNKLENFKLNFNGYFMRGGLSIYPWGK
jgi:hypothetical protein